MVFSLNFHGCILCILKNVLCVCILLSKNQKSEILCFKERNKKGSDYSFFRSSVLVCLLMTVFSWQNLGMLFDFEEKITFFFFLIQSLCLVCHDRREPTVPTQASLAWHILPLLASILWTVGLGCGSIKQAQEMKNFSLLTLNYKNINLHI